MSEVDAEEFRVVNADKFEDMESQLAALREELRLTADMANDAMQDLQQRLADAERRNAELQVQMQQAVNLLSEARSLIPDFGGSKRFSAFRLNFPKFISSVGFTRTNLPKKVDAALNKPEEAKS